MEKKKAVIYTGLSVALAVSAVQAVRIIGDPGQPPTPEQTATAELGTVASTVSAAGNLNAPTTLGLVFARNAGDPGLVTAVDVAVGDMVQKGQPLAKVDDRPARNELALANAAALSAKAQLTTAKQLVRAGRSQVAAAAQTLDNAEVAVVLAKRRVRLTAGTSAALIGAAERQVDAARRDVTVVRERKASATRQLTTTTPLVPPAAATTNATLQRSQELQVRAQTSSTRSAVADAAARAVTAQTNRATALVTAKQDVVTRIGEAELARRNVGVAAATNGVDGRYGTPGVIATAKAAIANAKAQVNVAKTSLDNTVLKAPVNGTIVYVAGSVGETPVGAPRGSASLSATPNGRGAVEDRRTATESGFVVMADLTHREVTALVDEADIGKVESGQKVAVTFPSTGTEVAGTVRSQDVQETVLNNVLQYRVQIALDGDASKLKLGQSASVTITTAERRNVLEVPNAAVRQAGQQAIVTVKRGTDNVVVPVTVGLVGDLNTEVTSPLLKPGDVVVLNPAGGGSGARPPANQQPGDAEDKDGSKAPARKEDTGSPEGHGH